MNNEPITNAEINKYFPDAKTLGELNDAAKKLPNVTLVSLEEMIDQYPNFELKGRSWADVNDMSFLNDMFPEHVEEKFEGKSHLEVKQIFAERNKLEYIDLPSLHRHYFLVDELEGDIIPFDKVSSFKFQFRYRGENHIFFLDQPWKDHPLLKYYTEYESYPMSIIGCNDLCFVEVIQTYIFCINEVLFCRNDILI